MAFVGQQWIVGQKYGCVRIVVKKTKWDGDNMTKKSKAIKYGMIKDFRTKQVLKQYEDGIKDKEDALCVPKDGNNELMDLEYKGEIIGDVEIGSDGFLEIMFILDGKIFKLKRLPDNKSVVMGIFG